MKKGKNISFFIDNHMKLDIHNCNYIKHIHCCTEGTIGLKYDREIIIIGLDHLNTMFMRFEKMFNQAIHKKLFLDPSITTDPGKAKNNYYYAVHKEERYDITNFKIEKSENGYPYWIGNYYMLCGFRHRQTWLYNDAHGNIILEITPSYHSLIKRRRKKISFGRWMVTKYKPILKRIIKPEIAQEWLDMAKNMLQLIEENNTM